MDKYSVKIMSRALRDLDGIYSYIAQNLQAPESGEKIVGELENAIFSLEEMPHRGPERKTGTYANRGYRQMFVQNYTVVYRVDETEKNVIVVTVRYSPSRF